jgi:Ca2+-binding RTX toxin-like protein
LGEIKGEGIVATLTQEQKNILSAITSNATTDYWVGYTFLSAAFGGDASVSPQLYWLSKATQINANDSQSSANAFIRAVTRYGYEFSDVGGYNIQLNSDLIGSKVIRDIIDSGQLPNMGALIDNDVKTAIEFAGQTPAGWGGAFYYWNLDLTNNEGTTKTVGEWIAGNVVEFEKFVTVNALATREVMQKFGLSPNAALEYFSTGLSAQTPLSVKALIIERVLSGVPTGDPERITLVVAGSLENFARSVDEDGQAHWSKFVSAAPGPVPTPVYIEVTDPELLSALEVVRQIRSTMGENPAMHNSNPDVGLKASGGIAAFFNDSSELGAILKNASESYTATENVQIALHQFAAWYAKRVVTIEADTTASLGALTVDINLKGQTEINFNGWLQKVLDKTGSNSLGQDVTLTLDEKALPKVNLLKAASDAIKSGLEDGITAEAALKAAVVGIWNAEATKYQTVAAGKLDYFSFETHDGSSVTLSSPIVQQHDFASLLVGGAGNDIINGSTKDDILVGGAGDDAISGGDGADVIFGGTGDDILIGGGADDYLSGGKGNDIIYDGVRLSEGVTVPDNAGNDIVLAGAGNDIVYAGGGGDIISLGEGDDIVHLSMPVTENGEFISPHTVLWGGAGIDSFYFQAGAQVLSLTVEDMSDLKLENLSTSAIFDYFKGYEIFYNYIIINLDAQDQIFVDGIQLTTATVVQVPGHEVKDYEFDYSYGYTGDDGIDYYTAQSMTKHDRLSQDDYFDMPGFEGPFRTYLTESDHGQAMQVSVGQNTFRLDGYANGAGGISFQGNGVYGWWQDTKTIQQIHMSTSTQIHFYPDGTAEVVPEIYSLVGEPVTEIETRDGRQLKPTGYGSTIAPTVDLSQFQYQELSGADGDDDLHGNDRPQHFHGGAGSNTANYGGSARSISLNLATGGTGGDAAGDTYDNIQNVTGGSGANYITGDRGANVLKGGGDRDYLEGGEGTDTLYGDEGNDNLFAGDGNDKVFGGSGDDFISGDAGSDQIDGGSGNDVYMINVDNSDNFKVYRNADNSLSVLSVTDGIDTIRDIEELWVLTRSNGLLQYQIDQLVPALSAANQINGTNAAESIYGTGVNDLINSGDGDDVISALAGNDFVDAGAGADSVTGGDGNDTLRGGKGSDTLAGGTGHDIYLYKKGDGSDIISDGGTAVDEIDALVLEEIVPTEVSLSRSGTSLVISFENGENTITVEDQYSSSGDYRGLEMITFQDGTVWDRTFIDLKVAKAIVPTPTLMGTTAGDTLVGLETADVILARAGDDTVQGSGGDDIIIGGDGADSLFGGDGNDTIYVDQYDTAYSGDDGADTLVFIGAGSLSYSLGQGNFENVTTSDGNDTIWGTDGANVINLGAGDDTAQGYGGDDIINGGAGADSLIGGDGNDTIYVDKDDIWYSGDNGVDTLIFTGTGSLTYALAQGGFENVTTAAGNDTIWGTDDANIIDLGAGDDSAQGYGGDDIIIGGAGADSLQGGDGNDTIYVDQDDTWYSGDDGIDTLIFTGAGSLTYALAQGGFENATTAGGNDTIWGTDGANVVSLGGGNDVAMTYGGNDVIDGGDGNDFIDGGAGNDNLTGGVGNDTFVFHAGFGQDTITDFTAGAGSVDVIQIDTNVFADFAAVMNAASQVGADTVITADASNVITLKNVTLSSLHQDDFSFAVAS